MNKFLVIGGAGFIGSAFIQKVLKENESNYVCVFSRNEFFHHLLKEKNQKNIKKIGFCVGDIKDLDAIRKCVNIINPTHIVIPAAMKRIEVCQDNPIESLMVNSVGIDNACRVATETDSIESVLYISTDKASNPTNVYGNTKAISEVIISNYAKNFSNKKFYITRFANVLNSTGSIIPIFKSVLKQKKDLTVRDEQMTRFFISAEKAAQIMYNILNGHLHIDSGDIVVPKCQSMKITNLAEIMVKLYNKNAKINISAPLPYEKIHETLISKNGTLHIKKENNEFYILSLDTYNNKENKVIYSDNTDCLVSKEYLKNFLIKKEILKYNNG